jgi:glycosidase
MFTLRAVTVLLSFIFSNALIAQPLRVEPMNWWIGMKNPDVQLLAHAVAIGETVPGINYPGVSIKKVNKADSKNYLFIDISISKNAKAGVFPIVFKRDGKVIYSFNYTLHSRKPGASQVKGFNASDVMYLVTPDRFANGDESNDVFPDMREKKLDRDGGYGRHGGDLRGMINQLDYLASMGITAIWPMPLLENDMPNASYHGYAITDFYKVDPRYGTLEEYKELAEKGRQKGIKLVFDGIANHCGVNYWWMNDKPFRNWINFPDSIQITNHRRTVNQDPYASTADKELMVRGWFVKDMPDMNQSNPFLSNYLIQNSIWWIETLGLAGIRQDTYPYSQMKFLGDWSCRIMNEYPAFSITGEEWSYNPMITSFWQKGKPNKSGYNGCLKSPMDFPMQAQLVLALTEEESFDKGMNRLYEGLANDFVYPSPQDLLVFGDNHDMDRLFTQLKNDVGLFQVALTYLLTTRGIPQLYYGTEVLMENSAKPGDHGLIRSDFPGGWKGDAVNGFTGEGLSADQQRIQSFVKKLLNWRKEKTVIHAGNTMHFVPENGLYVYFRYDKSNTVMVVINKGNDKRVVRTSRYSEMIKNKTKGKNVLTGEDIVLGSQFEIEPKSALVIELN